MAAGSTSAPPSVFNKVKRGQESRSGNPTKMIRPAVSKSLGNLLGAEVIELFICVMDLREILMRLAETTKVVLSSFWGPNPSEKLQSSRMEHGPLSSVEDRPFV